MKYSHINVFYSLADLKLNFICSWFYNFSFYYSSQLNFTTHFVRLWVLLWLYIYMSIIFFIFYFFNYKPTCYKCFYFLLFIIIIFMESTCARWALQTRHISPIWAVESASRRKNTSFQITPRWISIKVICEMSWILH